MDDVNIYSTASVKDLIRIRMDEFIYAIVLAIAIAFISFTTRTNYWAFGILLSILLFSLIGFAFSASSIYKINRFGMQIDRFSMSTRKMNEAFSSAGGMEKFFYLLGILMWLITYFIADATGFNYLNANSWVFLTIVEFLLLLYVAKKVVINLCFIIYYSSIILGYLRVEFAKVEKRITSNYEEVTSKLSRIKEKYIDKVTDALEDEENKRSQEEILIYQHFIREIDSVLLDILKL